MWAHTLKQMKMMVRVAACEDLLRVLRDVFTFSVTTSFVSSQRATRKSFKAKRNHIERPHTPSVAWPRTQRCQ